MSPRGNYVRARTNSEATSRPACRPNIDPSPTAENYGRAREKRNYRTPPRPHTDIHIRKEYQTTGIAIRVAPIAYSIPRIRYRFSTYSTFNYLISQYCAYVRKSVEKLPEENTAHSTRTLPSSTDQQSPRGRLQ